MDLFNYFIEISIDLLKEGGFLGFIIPSYWQDRTGATLLRRKIIDQTKIEHVVDLKDFKVFPGAPGQHNNIIILRKVAKRNDDHTFIYREFLEASSETLGEAPILTEPKIESYALIENKLIIGADTLAIIDKIKKQNVFYLESSEVIRGVDTGPGRYNGKGVFLLNEWEYAELSESLSDDICTYFFKPFFEAHQLDRYHFQEKNKYWLLYADNVRKKRLENGDSDCQLIIDHLDQFTANITSSNKPYGLHRAKQEKYFTSANKLMFVRKTKYPKFVPVPEPYFVDEAAYMIIMDSDKYSELYLASILNSSLAKWFFSTQKKHGEQLQIDKEQILVFPIYEIDFDNPSNKASYEKLVGLATNMLKLHKELYELNTTSADIIGDITQELKTKIENMDKKINGIICGLYNIVKNEQAIIEFSRTELNLSEVYD